MQTIIRVGESLYVCLIEEAHLATSAASRAQANGLLAQICDIRFVATLFLFDDVLDVLNHTCRLWQRGNVDVCDIFQNVQDTLTLIHSMKARSLADYTGRVDAWMERIRKRVHLFAGIVNGRELNRQKKEKTKFAKIQQQQAVLAAEAEQRGEEFKPSKPKKEKQKGNLMNYCKAFNWKDSAELRNAWDSRIRQPTLSAFEDCIRTQFPDNKLLQSFDVLFNPAKFPDSVSSAAHISALDILLQQYGVTRGGNSPVVNAEQARKQWGIFFCSMLRMKHQLTTELADSSTDVKGNCENESDAKQADRLRRLPKMRDVLARALSDSYTVTQCKDVVTLAELALVMSVYTVPCESGFSHLKLTKTTLRSSLGDALLNAGMFVVLEGPAEDQFPSAEAVRWWYPLKERRLRIGNVSACKDGRSRSATL